VTRPHRLFVAVIAAAGALFLALALAYPADGLVSDVDARVERWVAAEMPGWAEWLARPFTWAGGGIVLPLVALGAAAALWYRGARGDALFLVVVLALVNLTVWLLKLGFDRPRPDAGSPIPLPESPSFPSGHAANGVAVFGALGILAAARAVSQRSRRAWVVAGFALGAAVGASRVVLGVHYVSDVLAGYCVGLVVLCGVLLARPWVEASARPGTIAS
jgi:undecaprenyl-diphosphatase